MASAVYFERHNVVITECNIFVNKHIGKMIILVRNAFGI